MEDRVRCTNLPLSDEEWSCVAHLFPNDNMVRFGRRPRCSRELLNAILWVLINRERWERLPSIYPPRQTCYMKWMQWQRAGIMKMVCVQLGIDVSVTESRKRCTVAP
ncbi:transposase [Burkholderia vietnamiensis]|uniref:transposase n=1 Tax=Burkholderia vietnamiensis TaxID=60552 RepID=UPI0018DD2751|nr:transposase [Burkholderia vietnamiensis]MBR8008840.1 transposase [Burkholderia vietnamiensis]HDR8982666.1 transposase [Burkholderia vietnamiensis]HDR9000939.1 transposase [Burkholderia vietnamiensis]HDR9073614.1 transposase [Burkholderia vietnamiensis]